MLHHKARYSPVGIIFTHPPALQRNPRGCAAVPAEALNHRLLLSRLRYGFA